MKLNRNTFEAERNQNLEFARFQRRIMLQATGFGVDHGNLVGPFAPLESGAGGRPAEGRWTLTRGPVSRALGALGRAVSGFLGSVSDQTRDRRMAVALLKQPDYLLDDMGIDRADLEIVADGGMTLAQARTTRSGTGAREDAIRRAAWRTREGGRPAKPDTGLDRAA